MMTVPKKKIAFLKQGSFSHINHNIEEILRKHFPEYELVVIDIEKLLSRHRRTIAANIPWFMWEYGLSWGGSLAQYKKNFYRTSFLFRRLKEVVGNIVRPEETLFSFQTQSLFDLSVPGIPHYVYTDHAILSNLAYPQVTKAYIDDHYPRELRALEKTIYQNATMTFTMGAFVAKVLVDQYECSPEQVACVGGGSNLPAVLSEEAAPKRPDYSAKDILFLGVVWERKGGPELVAAFQKVRKRHPTATLTIVGSSPDIDVDGCTVIGPVPLATVGSYFRRASIFCMPSYREPFGISYIEASMNRLPVVATRLGAIPEIVHHEKSGLLVAPGDVEGLTDALDQLLSDPSRCQRFGDYGYRHVQNEYTWQVVGERLYERIQATLP